MAIPIVLGIILSAAGTLLIVKSVQLAQRSNASSAWVPIPGEILEATVVSEEKVAEKQRRYIVYRPQIRYRYNINGAVHESSSIYAPGWESKVSRKESDELVTRFPKGAKVDVFVNPANGKESVLVRGGSKAWIAGLIIGAMIDLGGVLLVVGALAKSK